MPGKYISEDPTIFYILEEIFQETRRRDMRTQTAPTSQLRIDATVQKFSVLAKTLCFSVIICNLIKTYPLPNPCKVFVEVKDCPLNFALKRIKFNFT